MCMLTFVFYNPLFIVYLCLCYLYSGTRSCLTLCDLMDCSPPGSFVYGILEARTLGEDSHSLLPQSSHSIEFLFMYFFVCLFVFVVFFVYVLLTHILYVVIFYVVLEIASHVCVLHVAFFFLNFSITCFRVCF